MGQLNYSTAETQKRLEQGYYDDIVAKGFTGTKTELDAILAKAGVAMKGATATVVGDKGLVPAPAAGAQGKYLRGDGTWQTPPNTTYNVATTTANGLMSANDKKRVDGAVVPSDIIEANLGALPVTPYRYSIKYTYTSATPIAIAFAATPVEGFECMIDILNSTSADIEQPLPNATPWQSGDATVTLPAGDVTPISIRFIHGKYCIRT